MNESAYPFEEGRLSIHTIWIQKRQVYVIPVKSGLRTVSYPQTIMKKEAQKAGSGRIIRRYSDHPIIQKKLAETNRILETTDLSFLDNPPRTKTEQ